MISSNLEKVQQLGGNLRDAFFSFNDVQTYWGSQGFAASSTLCAIASPPATSTLLFASAQIRTATGTDAYIDIARSATPYATTTLLNSTFVWDANAKSDLNGTIVASTSPADGKVIFAPNSWLVVRGTAKTLQADDGTGVSFLGVNGTCKAVWAVN